MPAGNVYPMIPYRVHVPFWEELRRNGDPFIRNWTPFVFVSAFELSEFGRAESRFKVVPPES